MIDPVLLEQLEAGSRRLTQNIRLLSADIAPVTKRGIMDDIRSLIHRLNTLVVTATVPVPAPIIDNTFWAPGSIVKLKKPYKPVDVPRGLRLRVTSEVVAGRTSFLEYREWPGFTYGIIAQVVAHDQQGAVSNVSLHLYDPEKLLFYIDSSCNNIPTYVDFTTSELIPWKRGADIGYTPL